MAEFSDLEVCEVFSDEDRLHVYRPDDSGLTKHFWPWSKYAPNWQIQSLLDAVDDKGLFDQFSKELNRELFGKPKHTTNLLGKTAGASAMFDVVSAPPEAICSAVLELSDT